MEKEQVSDLGDFEVYPNRDSLKYKKVYGLDKVETLIRGSMRKLGFCEAWSVLVELGMTSDSFSVDNLPNLTWQEFTASFLPVKSGKSLTENLADYVGIEEDGEIMEKIKYVNYNSIAFCRFFIILLPPRIKI